jgi:hypothetical protein
MKQLRDRLGFSLVESLVAIGVMSTMMWVSMDMILQQRRELKSISESLASMETQGTLLKTLSEPSTCEYALNQPTPRTFNSNLVSYATPQSINLNRIPAFASATAPTVVEVGQPPSANSNSLIVESIRLSLYSRVGSNFTAEWIIEWNPANMIRLLKPIRIPTIVTADISNPTAATILNCNGSGNVAPVGDFGGLYSYHRVLASCQNPNSFTGSCTCPLGFSSQLVLANGYDDGTTTDDQNIYYCFR